MTRWFSGFGVLLGFAAVGSIYLGAVGLAVTGYFEGFLALTLLGGIVTALLLIRANSGRRPAQASPDPFARDAFSTDTLNIAHIRVAGVGGVGLLLAAVAVAFQYQLVAAVVAIGLMGGAIVGGALILGRRHSGHVANTAGSGH